MASAKSLQTSASCRRSRTWTARWSAAPASISGASWRSCPAAAPRRCSLGRRARRPATASGFRPTPWYNSPLMLYYLLVALYLIVCLLLLLVVLMQQGKGGDMASAFGGGGSSQTAFGARAGATVLTRATTVLGALFMLGAIILGVYGTRGPGS